MQWVQTSSFEHSNRELLALYTCRDMAVFVIHNRSQEVPGGPRGVFRGLRDVPGGLRDVPWGPRGVPGRPRSVPGGPRAVSGGPRGVLAGPRGVPKESWDPRGLRGRPGHPRDPFHKDYSIV